MEIYPDHALSDRCRSKKPAARSKMPAVKDIETFSYLRDGTEHVI
jgi:hypothetical protein